MKHAILFLLLGFMTACSQGLSQSALQAASGASRQVGCTSFKDSFYDSLYHQIQETEPVTRASFEKALDQELIQNTQLSLSSGEKKLVKIKLSELYDLLTHEALKNVDAQNPKAKLIQLTSLELGDQTTVEKVNLQSKIKAKINELDQLTLGTNSSCTPQSGNGGSGITPSSDYLQYLKTHLPSPIYGAWKTLATAYQSCEAPFLDLVTTNTPPVQGITITGSAPDGIGRTRIIGNMQQVDSTHYYIKNFHAPSSVCFDVTKSPLIYDYGGKPQATSALNSKLDFFTDAGGGTAVLGVDCSGFIYTSLAAAGLKVKKDGRLKAIDVFGISSNMLFDPTQNGLSCLGALDFTNPKDIRPGDLIVEHGHVVMIDQVGADPFGLSKITSPANCLPSHINISDFNFAINQSSPVNGGLGMNRYLASDYFRQNLTMGSGLQAYAASLCQLKFAITPQFTSTAIAVVRHSDDPLCLDQPVSLNKEECLSSCPLPTFTSF